MATQNDLARAVLEELGKLGADEDIDASDSALVKKRYLAVQRDLERRFLADWDESEAIPDDALDAVTLLVAYRCARAFGKQPDVQMKMDGEAMLWDYRNTPPLPTPVLKVQTF